MAKPTAKKLVSIKGYKRKSAKGRIVKVKPYKKSIRTLGKKIRYREAGRFLVAFDEKGNFRGSKIVKMPKSKIPQVKIPVIRRPRVRGSKKTRRIITSTRKRKVPASYIDTAYFNKILSKKEWLEAKKKSLNLN